MNIHDGMNQSQASKGARDRWANIISPIQSRTSFISTVSSTAWYRLISCEDVGFILFVQL